MRSTISPDDESKPVRNASGERVGRVVAVDGETAHVDPDPGLTETFLAMLGWAEADDDGETYALSSEAVAEITDEEIRLTEF
ncbi:MAG: PRC-barrel domain containing protein [Halohasta sp.]